MQVLLMIIYIVVIADAYYTTFTSEVKEPPQLQVSQVTVVHVTDLMER